MKKLFPKAGLLSFLGHLVLVFAILIELWCRAYEELTWTIVVVGLVLGALSALFAWRRWNLAMPLPTLIALIGLILLVGFPDYISWSGFILTACLLVWEIAVIVYGFLEKKNNN